MVPRGKNENEFITVLPACRELLLYADILQMQLDSGAKCPCSGDSAHMLESAPITHLSEPTRMYYITTFIPLRYGEFFMWQPDKSSRFFYAADAQRKGKCF